MRPESEPFSKYAGVLDQLPSQKVNGRNGQKGLSSLSFTITLGSLAIAAGMLGWKCRENLLPNPNSVNVTGNKLDLDTSKLEIENSYSLALLIENYFRSKELDANIFEGSQGVLSTNPNPENISFAHQLSREYFEKGIILLQLKVGYEDGPKFEGESSQFLTFNERVFDLSDLYQYHLASALVDKTLELFLPDVIRPQTFIETAGDSSVLWWLKDNEYNIKFENDSRAFLSSDNMLATLARTLYLTRSLAPKPRLIQFYRYGDGHYQDGNGGYYSCGSYTSVGNLADQVFDVIVHDEWNCPILISSEASVDGIVHEIGHHIGANVEGFDYDNFKDIKETAKNQWGGSEINSDSNLFVTEYASTNNKEDYAETFANYITKGADFRQRLQQMRWWDFGAYKVISVKYHFFKDMFDGIELTDGHVFHDTGDSALEIGFSFIEDKSPSPFYEAGIHLRRIPTDLSSTDDTLIVHDRDLAEIVEGPVNWHQGENDQDYSMWKVKVTRSDGTQVEGWIAKEWLRVIDVDVSNDVEIQIYP